MYGERVCFGKGQCAEDDPQCEGRRGRFEWEDDPQCEGGVGCFGCEADPQSEGRGVLGIMYDRPVSRGLVGALPIQSQAVSGVPSQSRATMSSCGPAVSRSRRPVISSSRGPEKCAGR